MKVDVVLPVYDGAEYVGDAIESVLSQTYEQWELVVVDDGSTDRTPGVVRAYDDPRITLLENDDNRGVGASRNRGVRRVNGDLVAYLDHDDVWYPEKLRRHVERHRVSGADLVYSDVQEIAADGTVLGDARRPDPKQPGEPLVRQLLLEDGVVILTMSSVTVRRTAWEAVGGHDPDYRVSGDADFYVRLAGDHAFERIATPLVEKRDHDANISDRYRAMYRDHERIAAKALERYGFLTGRDERRCRARRAYWRATSALAAGEGKEATTYGREALRAASRPRIRPALVVGLGALDRATGPLSLGHRLFAAYDSRQEGR